MIAPDSNRLGVLESVLRAMNIGAIVLDNEARVVVWNSWMDRHSGHAAEAVLGNDFFALFPELKGKRIDSAVRQALRDNFPSVLSQTLHKAPFPLYTTPANRHAARCARRRAAVPDPDY
jgi:hypothetical protein